MTPAEKQRATATLAAKGFKPKAKKKAKAKKEKD